MYETEIQGNLTREFWIFWLNRGSAYAKATA
jgi:hypothetical protein